MTLLARVSPPLLFVLIGSLIGCGTSLKIESVVDRTSKQSLSDIGLVVTGPDAYWNQRISDELVTKLVGRNVKQVSFVGKPTKKQLSLGEENTESELQNFMLKCNKDQILVVQVTKLTTTNGLPRGLESECVVVDTKGRRQIWKSTINASSKFFGLNSVSILLKDFSESILAQLAKDGLLNS